MHAPSSSEPDDLVSTPCTRQDAEAGDAAAQFGLALYLAAGPTPDYAQALPWYLKAASQDHHLAQFNVGRMFAEGQGTDRDDSAALMWMSRAAKGGDPGAQFEMGNRYSRANAHEAEMRIGDVSESRIECYKWFKLSAAQGYRGAENRSDFATLEMTRDEVAEGERRVAAFVAT
jgi:TPR repeat protein